jgi:hypothetical protein
MAGSGSGCGRKRMTTRSDIDTGSTKSMHYYHKLCRNRRYRQRNRTMIETAVRGILVPVFFTALVATLGCSTQSPTRQPNDEELGDRGSLSSRLRDEWSSLSSARWKAAVKELTPQSCMLARRASR